MAEENIPEIYEINLKIAPLQLNTSQYLSRIEGSPPKNML